MSKRPWLAPWGILDFEYSPFTPFYFHLLNVVLTSNRKSILLWVISSNHLNVSIWLHFSFTFTVSHTFILHLSPLFFFFYSSLHLPSYSLKSPSIDRIFPSLFCIHVLRRRQKPAMLECVCSRSGADCGTAVMSF